MYFCAKFGLTLFFCLKECKFNLTERKKNEHDHTLRDLLLYLILLSVEIQVLLSSSAKSRTVDSR